MIPFRCSNCTRLLGKIEGKAEIKCPKCNTMNEFPRTLSEFNDGLVLKEDGWVFTRGGHQLAWVAPEDRGKANPQFWKSPLEHQIWINQVDEKGFFINK